MLINQEQVVIDNGRSFEVGYINERFERCGEEYAEVFFSGGKVTITKIGDCYPLKFFLSKVKAAEFEICSWCGGSGRIDPIENPPYKCDHCKGDGYYTAH